LLIREKERKRLIRSELDRQLQEKKDREQAECDEKRMYENLMMEHVKFLG